MTRRELFAALTGLVAWRPPLHRWAGMRGYWVESSPTATLSPQVMKYASVRLYPPSDVLAEVDKWREEEYK